VPPPVELLLDEPPGDCQVWHDASHLRLSGRRLRPACADRSAIHRRHLH
jgi:hypothetical protein